MQQHHFLSSCSSDTSIRYAAVTLPDYMHYAAATVPVFLHQQYFLSSTLHAAATIPDFMQQQHFLSLCSSNTSFLHAAATLPVFMRQQHFLTLCSDANHKSRRKSRSWILLLPKPGVEHSNCTFTRVLASQNPCFHFFGGEELWIRMRGGGGGS